MNPNKPVTIKLNKDFRTAYYHGGSQVHPALVTYVRKNRLGVTRVGITTGKKIGSAVARNRCRRVIREAYRSLSPKLRKGYDIVFVARVRTAAIKSTVLAGVMAAHLRKAGVLPALIRFYQRAISSHTQPACRFTPTCSAYALEAIERFGAFKGTGLALWRILRCNPWGGHGYDPVPEKKPRKEKKPRRG